MDIGIGTRVVIKTEASPHDPMDRRECSGPKATYLIPHDFSARHTRGSRWPRPVDVEINHSIPVDFARVHAFHLRMPLLPSDD